MRSGVRYYREAWSCCIAWPAKNWRGKPLTSYQAIINLIGATETTTGLKI